MFRPNCSSADARFVKPALEALEDRVVPSQLGDVLTNFYDSIKGTASQVNDVIALVNRDVVTLQPGDLGQLNTLIQDGQDLAYGATLLQQQSTMLINGIVLGVQKGLLDPSEAGPLLDNAIAVSNAAAQAQTALLQTENAATLATIDSQLNFGANGTDASGFDSNELNGLNFFGAGFFV